MRSIEGKVSIVTGASRGIGRAIARRLHARGALVHAVARSEGSLRELAVECPGLRAHVGDVARDEDVERIVGGVLAERGRVDILVNNAGIGVFGPIEEISWADFRRVLDVNAGGTFLFSRAVVPVMKRQGGGDIVNIASVVGKRGYPLQTAYTASKHAVMGLTRALAAETHAAGVRVRSISPGGVDTDMISAARPDLDRSILMRPEDVADALEYLLLASSTAIVDDIDLRRPGSLPSF